MIETARLILRPFNITDAEAAHVWFSDAEVFRFYTYGPYRSLDQTADRIREYIQEYETRALGKCLVIEKASGIPIGDAGLIYPDDLDAVHVGYKLARSYWGRGFATEAAAAWLDHGFTQLGLHRILAFVHPQNAGSKRVLQKLHFSLSEHRSEDGVDWEIHELHRRICRGGL